MSNFDIQYNFIAIDRFTKVARKVQREAAKIASTMTKNTKSMHINSNALSKTSSGVAKTAKNLENLGTITQKAAKKTNVGLGTMKKSMDESKKSFRGFTEYIAKVGDNLAFSGYIQFMNIGLPILLAGKMGMNYVNQMQTGQYMMGMGLGGQPNYGNVSKGIRAHAMSMSGKKTGFTEEQTMYTSGLLAKTFGRADWTKKLLKSALLEEAGGMKPEQAVSALKADILKGGKFMGSPIIGGASLAAKNAAEQHIVKLTETTRANKQLQFYAKNAAAQLNLLSGAFAKMMGVVVIQATPALAAFSDHLLSVAEVVGNFLKKFPKVSEGILWTAFAGLGLTIFKTIAGSIVSIFAMPFEITEKLVGLFRSAGTALGIFKKATEAATVAEEAETAAKGEGGIMSFGRKAGAILGSAAVLGGAAVGGVGLGMWGLDYMYRHPKTQKRAMQNSMNIQSQLGMQSSPLLKQSMAQLTGEAPDYMSGGMALAGFPSAQQKHKIDMEIKVTEDGKVKSVHATTKSPNVSLGVNMPHTLMHGAMAHG